MTISELQAELEQFKREHGDVECVVESGMDPSDPSEVTYVEKCHPRDWFVMHGLRGLSVAAFIRS